jgi:methanogenic corrinoid protein MtbC1
MLSEPDRDQFYQALLRGSREECGKLVEQALADALPLTVIYEQLFRDGLYRVGDGWCRGLVSVSVEHRATGIVEELMLGLYPRVMEATPTGRRAVSACLGSSLHQLGGRMVADVLESEGWQCPFLRGPLAPGDLAQVVARDRVSLVALSVTMREQLPALAREVAALRAQAPDVAVIAGGNALREGGAAVCAALPRVTWVAELGELVAYAKALG